MNELYRFIKGTYVNRHEFIYTITQHGKKNYPGQEFVLLSAAHRAVNILPKLP